MKNKIAKILRDNLIYCDCFVSEKGYDDVINSTTDLITEMFTEYEKQKLIKLLDWMDEILCNDPMRFETDNDDIVEMFLAEEKL